MSDLKTPHNPGIVIGGIYAHYKTETQYEVLGIGRHSETLEELVFYRAIEGEKLLWARPVGMFLEPVQHNDAIVLRFQIVSE